jgi:hypothetical protein
MMHAIGDMLKVLFKWLMIAFVVVIVYRFVTIFIPALSQDSLKEIISSFRYSNSSSTNSSNSNGSTSKGSAGIISNSLFGLFGLTGISSTTFQYNASSNGVKYKEGPKVEDYRSNPYNLPTTGYASNNTDQNQNDNWYVDASFWNNQ